VVVASAGLYAHHLYLTPYRSHITPTHHHSIIYSRMFFLMPNQQCQNTEGNSVHMISVNIQKSSSFATN